MNDKRTDLAHMSLTVPGMGSDHCAGIVRESLERLDGITAIRTNISNHRVRVGYDPERASADAIRRAVEKAGYEVASTSGGGDAAAAASVRLVVPGMGSDHCAGIVKDSLRRLPGIGEIRTNI